MRHSRIPGAAGRSYGLSKASTCSRDLLRGALGLGEPLEASWASEEVNGASWISASRRNLPGLSPFLGGAKCFIRCRVAAEDARDKSNPRVLSFLSQRGLADPAFVAPGTLIFAQKFVEVICQKARGSCIS